MSTRMRRTLIGLFCINSAGILGMYALIQLKIWLVGRDYEDRVDFETVIFFSAVMTTLILVCEFFIWLKGRIAKFRGKRPAPDSQATDPRAPDRS